MDTVRAVINIGEASVQLEGSREFVEKYLDRYGSLVENWQKLPPASRKATEETKVETKLVETKRPRSSVKSGCSEKVRMLLNENYFAEPRTNTNVLGNVA